MNVFEDLIDELKEENLLEETVIETHKIGADDEYLGAASNETDLAAGSAVDNFGSQLPRIVNDDFETESADFHFSDTDSFAGELFAENNVGEKLYSEKENLSVENLPVILSKENKKPQNEKEFYRKRAIEEVSGLQMVEHILSGVEREQMKIMPKVYNDIATKKALHDFLQISGDIKSPEHAQSEFQLMQETETWCSALSHRDKRISVAHLRRYCEMSKPALSTQALIALARFYRNLPYSESVRGKFDFIVTKLFSKDVGNEKRVLVFDRDQLIEHLKDLYAEWSSIPLYSTDDNDSEIVLAALKFEDFMSEAELAGSFDELVKNDFFNRLRLFKESANEVFYAPLVTATAIECNVRIGNSFVDLIENEREKTSDSNLQDKYGFLHDQAISDSTSKTLQLADLLKEKSDKTDTVKVAESVFAVSVVSVAEKKVEVKTAPKTSGGKKAEKSKKGLFEVNKWLLTATIFVAVASGGLYFWVNYLAVDTNISTNVKKVNLENSSLKEFIHTARISEDIFYGVTLPTWEGLSTEKKEELLKKIYSSGSDKGYTKVHLLNKEGKTVGYAAAEKTEVMTP